MKHRKPLTRSFTLAWCALLAGALVSASTLAAQSIAGVTVDGPPPPVFPDMVARDAGGRVTMRATRLTAPLVIDGRLDDEVYRIVPAVGGFIQQNPEEGKPASEPTDVWIFFDAERIYVSARCWDSRPDRIVANEMRRDNGTINNNDSLTFLLDTFYDRRNGIFIQTNALGALRDMQITDEGNANEDWNTIWDVKVNRDDKGWTLEMVIPFKSLRYKASGEQIWGVNIRRIVYSKAETSYLSSMPRGSSSFKFSKAGSLVGIEVPRQPRNIELKPYATAGALTNLQAAPSLTNDVNGDAGIDAKYGVTNGLVADFTVNTDFAQVEEDEQQVNLTRFSLLFPEKRDFFLEGQGIFAFGGINPEATSGLTPIVFFSRQIGLNAGREVPIRAGARLTGRAGAYTVGLLNIGTGESKQADAVATNFSVVRIRRDILRRSTVGLIGTHRAQRPGGAPGSNQVFGMDATLAFFTNLAFKSYYTTSRTTGVERGASSYRATMDYTGDRYGLNLERLAVGEGFNPEIGFLPRESFQRSFGLARFSPRPRSSKTIRRFVWEGSADYITDPDGRLESREAKGTFRLELNSGDVWATEISRNHEFLERPFRVAGGAVVAPGGYDFQEYRTSYTLAPHHRVAGVVNVSRGSFYDGDRTTAGYSGRLDLGARLGIEPRASINWVDLPAGRFTTRLTGARIGFTMSPHMAVTGLLQYNSSAASLTSNLRFRWEYQSGSDLFIVYSDGRTTRPSGFPELDNRTFVVKATRLFRW